MAVYYISTTGDDTTGDGSQGNPWATLSKFLSSSSGGDTCMVEDGTYNFTTNTVIINRTITAVNNTKAIFRGPGTSTSLGFEFREDNEINGIVFENFYKFGIFHFQITPGLSSFNYCIFRNNIIPPGPGGHNSGMFKTDLSSSDNTRVVMLGCLLYGNYAISASGDSCAVWSGVASNDYVDLTMNNCVIANTVQGTTTLRSFAYSQSGGSMKLTCNNTIFYNASGEVFKMQTGSTNTIVNESINYCDLYQITLNSVTIGDGIITSNPLFVDESNGNFQLSPSSPCIDAGTLV